MYSSNLTEKEILDVEDKIKEFNKDRKEGTGFYRTMKILVINTRLVKEDNGHIIYRVASVDKHQRQKFAENMHVEFGDHSAFLKQVNEYLLQVLNWTADKNQHEMLELYISYFTTGDVGLFKQS